MLQIIIIQDETDLYCWEYSSSGLVYGQAAYDHYYSRLEERWLRVSPDRRIRTPKMTTRN